MKQKWVWIWVLALVADAALIGLATSPAQGEVTPHAPKTTRCVNPGNPACFSTIQAAINASSYGDLINVANGTYTEHVTMKNGVSVYGAGWDQTVINGNFSSSQSTVYFPLGIDATTVLSGVQVAGGGSGDPNTSANGGGILIMSASPHIVNTWVNNNTGYWGGGVCVWSGSPTFTNVAAWLNRGVDGGAWNIRENAVVTITSDTNGTNGLVLWNSSATRGGGLSILTSTVTLSGLRIWGNNATSNTSIPYGGGIYWQNSKGVLQQSSIFANATSSSITSFGGGTYGTGSQTLLTLEGNWFDSNRTDGEGGGLRLYDGASALINANVFLTNTAYTGGGVSTYLAGPITFTNNIAARNVVSANQAGGFSIISTFAQPTRLINNTIADNQGDGIYLYYAPEIVIYNNIIFQNSGVGVHNTDGAATDADYNDVLMNSNDGYAGTHGLHVVPQFVGTGDMRAYYHIQATSPVTSTGLLSIAPPNDIDGDARLLFASMGADQIPMSLYRIYLPFIRR